MKRNKQEQCHLTPGDVRDIIYGELLPIKKRLFQLETPPIEMGEEVIFKNGQTDYKEFKGIIVGRAISFDEENYTHYYEYGIYVDEKKKTYSYGYGGPVRREYVYIKRART